MKIKRSLAMLLAGLMVASTGSVAFAEYNNEDVRIDPNGGYYYYDKDTGRLEYAGKNAGEYFAPGDTIYIPLDNDHINQQGLKTSDVKKYKVFADWSVGSKNVGGLELVYKKANIPNASQSYEVTGYSGDYASLNGTYSSESAYNTKKTNLLANYAQDLYNTQYAAATKTPSATTVTYTVKIPVTTNEVWKRLLPTTAYTSTVEGQAKQAFLNFFSTQKIMDAKAVSDAWVDVVVNTVVAGGSYNNINVAALPITADSGEFIKGYIGTNLNGTFVSKEKFIEKAKDVKDTLKSAIDSEVITLKGKANEDASSPAAYNYTVSGFVPNGPFVSLNKVYTSNKNADDAKLQFTDVANGLVASLKTQFVNNISKQRPTTKYTTNTGYAWFAAITTKDNSTTKVLDLVGEIDVTKTSTAAKKYDGFDLEVGLTNGLYEEDDVSGSISIDSNTGAVVSFDRDAGDVDITWGDDLALFEVNATNQGDLNLSYNTKYIEDFADKYSSANIDFITFPAIPSFNRTGTMYLYADEDTFVYEVTNQGAKKIDAVYDDTYGAWRFKTRTLSSYAISDKRLNTTTSSSSSSAPSTTPPTSGSTGGTTGGGTTGGSGGITGGGLKPNPDTGR